MAGVVAVGAWLMGDPSFRVDPGSVTVSGARFTDEAAIRARTGLTGDARPTLFILGTRRMEVDIARLPTVVRADVTATLPDRVSISVVERAPMVAWWLGDTGWLVDVEGVVLGPTTTVTEAELGDGATGSTLPGVTDDRTGIALVPGERVDPMDLEAVRLLGSLTPELVHSRAPALALSIDDEDGFVLSWPGRWRAVFGHYTRTLLPPERIPAQVQCLAALLEDREATVDGATLAVAADRCGTYLPGTPEPTRRARRTPRPDADGEG
jgi:hypothetical protein